MRARHAFINNFGKERIYVRGGIRAKIFPVRLTFILRRIPAASERSPTRVSSPTRRHAR